MLFISSEQKPSCRMALDIFLASPSHHGLQEREPENSKRNQTNKNSWEISGFFVWELATLLPGADPHALGGAPVASCSPPRCRTGWRRRWAGGDPMWWSSMGGQLCIAPGWKPCGFGRRAAHYPRPVQKPFSPTKVGCFVLPETTIFFEYHHLLGESRNNLNFGVSVCEVGAQWHSLGIPWGL